MGLDDLVEDKGGSADSSSSGNSGSSRKASSASSTDEPYKEIGGGRFKKSFTEEKWEGVKEIIHHEMGETVNVILNKPPQERFKILHEAALIHDGEKKRENFSYSSSTRCHLCGNACDNSNVEIEGQTFCPQHSAMRVRKALDGELK